MRKILAIPMQELGDLKGDITKHRLTLMSAADLKNSQTVKATVDLLSSMNIVASANHLIGNEIRPF